MAYSAIEIQFNAAPEGAAAADTGYGEWSDHRIPEDRSAWHPLTRRFYEYWLAIAPLDALPGRQHVAPEMMTAWLSRLWLLDIFRNPLRYRCRLAGSDLVRSIGREVTGCWLDEVHPRSVTDPGSRERFRYVTETGRPTWRRGTPRWGRQPECHSVESVLVPLAADGQTVDKIMAISITLDLRGRLI